MSNVVRRSAAAVHRLVSVRAPAAFVAGAFVAASAAAAFAQAPAAVAPPPAPLTRALETVQVDEIRDDIFFIASDELGGRDTPSVGQRVAARFIRNRLQRLGFKPGAPHDAFFYEYPLLRRRIAEPETHATVKFAETRPEDEPLDLKFGDDYVFFDLADLETAGGVVCCGTGTAEDFQRSDAAGKWALIWEGGDNPPGFAANLEKSKAVGVLTAPKPDAKRDARNLARLASRLRKGRVEYPGEENAGRGERGLPRVALTAAGRDKLLGFADLAAPNAGDDLKVVLTEARKVSPDSGITCEDVCGFWPGSDPELSKQVILCSAHYDHLGTTDEGVIYNGADDNGSGTCGLLALAEALAVNGPLRRSVMIIWVSGEEKGLFGSRAWSDHPYFPNGGKAVADINIDMIGRNAKNQILITPTAQHEAYNGLTRLAESFFGDEGFTEVKSADDYYMRSDHAMFARLGIPITFLFDDVHVDYHQPTDKPEKIDCDKIRRVVRVVVKMLASMQTDALDLAAKPPAPAGVK
jgi:hypothetical protein